jgi:hypothetical protein
MTAAAVGLMIGIGLFVGVVGWQILGELYKITELLHTIAGAKRAGRRTND